MIEDGWLDEAAALIDFGLDSKAHPMDSLGYRNLLRHLEGRIDLSEAVDRIKIETRQFARKQLKWFDREATDHTINMKEMSTDSVVNAIQGALNQF